MFGLESSSDLVCLKASSCIVGGMSANLSLTFKSTATAARASFTSLGLDGADDLVGFGCCNGGKANDFCPVGGCGYRHSTPSLLFFAASATLLVVLAFSASEGLSMRESERERECESGWHKCLKSLNLNL